MSSYLKLSFLALCAFGNIQASVLVRKLNLFNKQSIYAQAEDAVINKYKMKINSNDMQTPSKGQGLMVLGSVLGVAGLGAHVYYQETNQKMTVAQYKQQNKYSEKNIVLQETNQKMTVAQYKQQNQYAEKNIALAESAKTRDQIRTGIQVGGAMAVGGKLVATGAGLLAKSMVASAVVGGGGSGAGAAGAAAAAISAALATTIGAVTLASGGIVLVGGAYVIYRVAK